MFEDFFTAINVFVRSYDKMFRRIFLSSTMYPILLNIDSNDRLTTSPYGKPDYLDFAIVNFQFLCNIPLSPAHRMYVPQLIDSQEHLFRLRTLRSGETTDKNVDVEGFCEYRMKS
jgi:hypothetical protein